MIKLNHHQEEWGVFVWCFGFWPQRVPSSAPPTSATADTCLCRQRWFHWTSSSTARDCTRTQTDTRPPSGLSSSPRPGRSLRPAYLRRQETVSKQTLSAFSSTSFKCSVLHQLTWEETDEQHHHPARPGVQQTLDQLPDGLFTLTGDLDKQRGQDVFPNSVFIDFHDFKQICGMHNHWTHLAVSVCVSGFLPQPVDGVEIFIGAHVRKRLVQEIHQVSSSVHLLCGRGTADTCQRGASHLHHSFLLH